MGCACSKSGFQGSVHAHDRLFLVGLKGRVGKGEGSACSRHLPAAGRNKFSVELFVQRLTLCPHPYQPTAVAHGCTWCLSLAGGAAHPTRWPLVHLVGGDTEHFRDRIEHGDHFERHGEALYGLFNHCCPVMLTLLQQPGSCEGWNKCATCRMPACRRELLPFNEFGHAEVLTRAQLRRRLGNYRQGRAARAARAQAEFLEDPADARLSAAKQWLLERRRCDAVWLALDEPQSSRAAWWIALTLRFLVVMSLVLNILEVGDEYPLIHGAAASVLEIGIDSAFFIEFLCRLFSAPSKRTYVLDFYNWADMVSASGLILRATAGFVIAPSSTATESVIQSLLLYVLPIVRLLKLLRYISSFRLLIDAVTNSLEALPVLVYTMVLIVMASASGLYLAESRSNIPTLAACHVRVFRYMAKLSTRKKCPESDSD